MVSHHRKRQVEFHVTGPEDTDKVDDTITASDTTTHQVVAILTRSHLRSHGIMLAADERDQDINAITEMMKRLLNARGYTDISQAAIHTRIYGLLTHDSHFVNTPIDANFDPLHEWKPPVVR
jgi:hypothetical protein